MARSGQKKGKKDYIFAGPVIFRLCHPWRGMDVPSVFIMSLASKFMSNRSKKVLLSASGDTLKVRPAQESGPACQSVLLVENGIIYYVNPYSNRVEMCTFLRKGAAGPLFFCRSDFKSIA